MVSTNDIESQINDDTQPQPPIDNDPPPTNTPNTQPPTSADAVPQVANTDERHNGNPPPSQTADNPEPAVQWDKNHRDSSDGLWSMYLTKAEKQDNEVTENWKGETDGVLVFTGLFSATVAAFIIESYKLLSPNSGDTTNALLAQISGQLVNISNGTPLTSVAAQSSLPFKPTASAVRVNAFWFFSLVISLNCALSAALMQQWARQYQELTRRRGATHKCGRMRAFIFDGLNRSRVVDVVKSMPGLMHIAVFLFFIGLVDFLFPINTTVAYVCLACSFPFIQTYTYLTILPTIFFNFPYGTPLSGAVWRTFHSYAFVFLRTTLTIRESLSKIWSLAKRRAPESDRLQKWRKTLEERVKVHRQLLLQGPRKSVELSAYRMKSMVVAKALEWTLTALDEDKEIEDFAARVPGFFDSRVVPDATSALLPLMSHEPDTDPIFGSRLYDLLKTCKPETSVLDEKMRKNRLRICMNCLWYFGTAYNQPSVSQPLPSYFPKSLILEIVRHVHNEEDTGVRVIGHCFLVLIVNKLAADIDARTFPANDAELTCLSAILGTKSQGVTLLLTHPSAIQFANMLFFLSDNIYSSSSWRPTSDVLDVVQQTFSILSPALPAQLNAGTWLDLTDTMKDVSKGSLSLSDVMRGRVLDRCLKNMWDFTRVHIKHGNLVPLPSYFYITFTHPVITRRIRGGSTAAYVKSRCIGALVVNKIAADINSRTVPVSDVELASLSSILDSDSRDVRLCLTQPGFVELVNIASIPLHPNTFLNAKDVPLDARDVFQETLDILSQALPAEENAELQSDQTIALSNISDDRFERTIVSRLHGALKTCILSTSSLAEEVRTSYLRLSLKALWHSAKAYHRTNNPLPPYFPLILASPEITQHFQTERDPVARLTGCCFGALIVSNLVDALKSPISLSDHVDNAKLACILAILGKEHHRNLLSFHQLWVINLWNVISLMSSEIDILFTTEGTPADMLDISQDTLYILVNRLHNRSFGFEDVPTDQRELLLDLPAEVLKIRVEVLDAVDSDLDRLKDQTMKILDRLRQVLEKI